MPFCELPNGEGSRSVGGHIHGRLIKNSGFVVSGRDFLELKTMHKLQRLQDQHSFHSLPVAVSNQKDLKE